MTDDPQRGDQFGNEDFRLKWPQMKNEGLTHPQLPGIIIEPEGLLLNEPALISVEFTETLPIPSLHFFTGYDHRV